MDRVCSLRKIPTRHRGTNFCPCSACFAPSSVRKPNGPKCTQIVRNAPKFLVYGPMGWIGCVRCETILRDFVSRTFALVRPFDTEFCKAAKRFQMQPNSMKRTKIFNLGSNGWIGCVRCEKFLCDFVVRTFALVPLILHQVS